MSISPSSVHSKHALSYILNSRSSSPVNAPASQTISENGPVELPIQAETDEQKIRRLKKRALDKIDTILNAKGGTITQDDLYGIRTSLSDSVVKTLAEMREGGATDAQLLDGAPPSPEQVEQALVLLRQGARAVDVTRATGLNYGRLGLVLTKGLIRNGLIDDARQILSKPYVPKKPKLDLLA